MSRNTVPPLNYVQLYMGPGPSGLVPVGDPVPAMSGLIPAIPTPPTRVQPRQFAEHAPLVLSPDVAIKYKPQKLPARANKCNYVEFHGDQISICGKSCPRRNDLFLDVCSAHQDEKIPAIKCIFVDDDGKPCGERIRPNPPEFDLCHKHRGWKVMPCHIMRIPTELRREIFTYLLPDKPISAFNSRPVPLRQDKVACTLGLLRVNKTINKEASEVLYGTHPYTAVVADRTIAVCGRMVFPHSLDDSPYGMPTRWDPAMFRHIRNVRIQLNLLKIKEGSGHFADFEVRMWNLRDSVLQLAKIINRHKLVHTLTVVLCVHNVHDKWNDDDVFEMAKLVTEPLLFLRNITHVSLEFVYEVVSQEWIAPSVYIMDHVEPTQAIDAQGNVTMDDNVLTFDVPTTIYSPKVPPMTVLKQLTEHEDFLTYKEKFQTTLRLLVGTPGPLAYGPALIPTPEWHRVCGYYQKMVDLSRRLRQHYSARMPDGKEGFIHRARLLREIGDETGLQKLFDELEKKMDDIIKKDLRTLKLKHARVKRDIQDVANSDVLCTCTECLAHEDEEEESDYDGDDNGDNDDDDAEDMDVDDDYTDY
ncbi:hypothetical protein EJ06DRAFT_353530 [Trichodelitschia bisporula]|uniref:Probable treble clef zinc finger fungi domain-containing protein n=1 Tax=Trichodelitschia bisporula TaxID=703511 RepID=A0A6G1I0C6_9PEZI|nr:hypothetical protein EJ06DRAFT_353530 [Trichodelitschia bisporula]